MALKPSDRVTLSLSARVLVNVEALNMAETVGNVSRHRRAPVVIVANEGPKLVYVPVVSGESLAHHYQKTFVKLAEERELKIPKIEKEGYFLKYARKDMLDKYYPEVTEEKKEFYKKDICGKEKILVEESAVGDVGGFLYTEDLIKRTSRIQFSYMAPTLDSVLNGAMAVHSQIHSRYSKGAEKKEQVLYYVEGASALYSFSVVLSASDIGKLEYCSESLNEDERKKRAEVALNALVAMLDSNRFGAKLSRYLPHFVVDSLIASVSVGPVDFMVSSGSNPEYIEETVKRAAAIKKGLGGKVNIQLFAYVSERSNVKIPQQRDGLHFYDSHAEALVEATAAVRRALGIDSQAEKK